MTIADLRSVFFPHKAEAYDSAYFRQAIPLTMDQINCSASDDASAQAYRDAISQMAASRDVVVVPRMLGLTHDKTVYFVGPQRRIEAAGRGFQSWLVLEHANAQLTLNFLPNLNRTATPSESATVAWLPVAAGVIFTLDEDLAQQIASSVS